MTSLLPLLLAVATQASPPPAAAPAGAATPKSLALLPLKLDGLQLNDAARMNLALRTRLLKEERFAVQDQESTDALVASSQSLGLDCEVTDALCAVELGQVLDVERVLFGQAVLLDNNIGVSMALIDVTERRALRSVSGLLPAMPGEQVPALAEVLRVLLDDAAPTASIAVTALPDGATVRVNGVARGTTPLLEPITGVLPGQAMVRIEKAGHLSYDATLALEAAATATVDVALLVDPEATTEREISLLERSIPLAVAGAGVIMLVGGVVAGVVGMVPYALYSFEVNSLSTFEPTSGQPDQSATEASLGHDRALVWAGHWNVWGQAAVIGGGAVAVLGLVGLAVGGGWAGYPFLATAGE